MILTVGVEWRRLGIPGVERFAGRGVFYGAARTEAVDARQDEALFGGGDSARTTSDTCAPALPSTPTAGP
jgi:thioredoxin reductase (NADPH)